jgi:hypothetical protein
MPGRLRDKHATHAPTGEEMPDTPDDTDFDEQFPLSAIDDHLIHQTPDPIRVMWSSDPRTYERHWAVFHDDAGELMIVTGGSFYPSLDTAEAYAIVVHKGEHRSVRAFRPLGADRMDLHIGPIRPTIVQGLRRWRFLLEENAYGIAFDLDWRDTRRQIFHGSDLPSGSGYPKGRREDITAGFEGFGTVEGWVEIDGQRIKVTRDGFHGTRDRHWGIGRGVGGPNLQFGQKLAPGWIGGNWISFKDFAIWGNVVLYNFGDSRKGLGKVVKTERRMRFDPDTRIFREGIVDYTFKSGEKKQVRFERLGDQTAFMKCGMYGGTPETNIYQGMAVGERVEGDRYDVTDPETRRKLSGLNEHHCRITCDGETTTGILQPVEPDAYEACAQGLKGWRFLD